MSKDSNWYFDNDAIESAIREYQRKLYEEGVRDYSVIEPYLEQIRSLIRIIINTYKIYRFYEDVDELEQEAMVAIIESLDRIDFAKGTAFNYFSFVAKNHLKAWTQRLNKKRYVTREYNPKTDGEEEDEEHHDSTIFDDITADAFCTYDDHTAILIREVMDIIRDNDIRERSDLIAILRSRQWRYTQIRKIMDAIQGLIGDE